MLKSRKELIELIEFGYDIKEIINLWDPLNLLYISPEDEYEAEIRIIRNLVVNNKNINKKILSQKIRKIFKNSFSYEYNPKKDIEENIASKIVEKSKKYKLSNTVSVSSDYDIENVIWQDNKNIDIYMNLFRKIKEIINLWDPLKIMNISFNNEYSYEINRIIEELLKNTTIQNLNQKINKIFKNSYNGIYKVGEKVEIEIAKKILEECNNML